VWAWRLPRPVTKCRSQSVQFRVRLEIDQVTTAMAAVTEAIHLHRSNDDSFNFLSSTTIHQAKLLGGNEMARGIRPGSFLMFPWVHNETYLELATGVEIPNYAEEIAKLEISAHIFLVHVHEKIGPLRLPSLEFLDSVPGFWESGRNPLYLKWTNCQVQKTAPNFGVLGPPPLINGIRLEGAKIPFEDTVRRTHAKDNSRYIILGLGVWSPHHPSYLGACIEFSAQPSMHFG
jgi:hypothetical protein